MKIHEFQAKEILRRFGLPVPTGRSVTTAEEAFIVAQELGAPIAVKAQIHAGGRGKGGGVKIARTAEEARTLAAKMIGMQLITHQTGPEGQQVRKLLIEKGCDIGSEYYLALTLDRQTSRLVLLASTEGGMEIEEVAHRAPEKILKTTIDPAVGLQSYQVRKIGFAMGLAADVVGKFVKVASALYRAYLECDASLAEINPLVLTQQGELVVLDAKLNLDDNALFRHKELAELKDPFEEDPKELEAQAAGLSYIALNGNIGCLVNGAGLAMATMDIIKLAGGEPANFLDVGGGATQEQVTRAFKIILSDKNVKGVLVNIFGGIMKCDIIAHGVVAAAKEISMQVPLVVRLQGTNVDLGRKILADSGLKIIPADTMADAAQKIVQAVG